MRYGQRRNTYTVAPQARSDAEPRPKTILVHVVIENRFNDKTVLHNNTN